MTKAEKALFNSLTLTPELEGACGHNGIMHILAKDRRAHCYGVCSLSSSRCDMNCGAQYYEVAGMESARRERDRTLQKLP